MVRINWFHVELKTIAPAVFADTYTWESGYGRIQSTAKPDNEEKTEASFIIGSNNAPRAGALQLQQSAFGAQAQALYCRP